MAAAAVARLLLRAASIRHQSLHLVTRHRSLCHASSGAMTLTIWQPHRRFAVSSAGDFVLLEALRQEIELEREAHEPSEKAMKQPPQPFTIIDKPGIEEVYLKRSYGDEDITVACLLEEATDSMDDDEQEETVSKTVEMTVKISKGEDYPYLEIVCTSYGEDPIIDRICYREQVDANHLPFAGPVFMDLDDNVKLGFLKYLCARGIDALLGEYVLQYMYDKEQREYSRWVQKVEAFIAK